MTMTVWKFPLSINVCRQGFLMPAGSQSLCVQLQRGEPMLWVLCDPSAPMVTHDVAIYGTGYPMLQNVGHRYVGTFQIGRLVYHVFEVNDFRIKR